MGSSKYEVGERMLESIHACIDLLHVGYHVKEEYDPIILNVYHCLKMEHLNDEQYLLHIDAVLKKSVHDLNETEIYTYITYVFEKENYVPYFLKGVVESGVFKEVLLRYIFLKESDTLQCIKLNRNLLSKWHYASISEEVAQNLTISASGRVFLTRYIMTKQGVKPLKTIRVSISKENACKILEAVSKIDLESKEVEENGWQLRMYKNAGGKNRLVKTITHDDKNPNGLNEMIRSYVPLAHLFVFGGSYYSWEKE